MDSTYLIVKWDEFAIFLKKGNCFSPRVGFSPININNSCARVHATYNAFGHNSEFSFFAKYLKYESEKLKTITTFLSNPFAWW